MTARKTTAEWFAEALERCGVGNYILLSDAIKIMHRIGWETKSKTEGQILTNVHSRVYKHRRHAERHPEDALPIDYSRSGDGLYAYQPKVKIDKRARPPAVSWNLPRRGARPFFRGGGVDGERNGRAAEPGSAVAPGAVLVKRLSPAAERSPPPCRGLRLNFPAGFVSGLHIYRDGQHRDETEHYFRCPAHHGWHRSPLNGAPVLATRGAHRRRFQRSVDRHHPRSRR